MRKETRLFVVAAVSVLALSASGAFAQQSPGRCPLVEYSERMTNPAPYRLQGIEGQAVYGDVGEKGELVGAAGICVYLFDRHDKHLIASLATDPGGQFQFASLPSGKYVLNVSMESLRKINIPVEVADRQSADGKAAGLRWRLFKRWELLLHLRSREDRKKSFVTPITQPLLREELLELVHKDQAVRNDLIQSGADRPHPELERHMAVVDADNTARLKEIIKRYGWPGQGLVGRDGAEAAFMLLLHSPDLALQRAMLPAVRRNYERGQLSAWNYALLIDNVLVREGKPQMYGMSLKRWNGQEPVLNPILDEARVDRRRAKIGLAPLREYLEFMKRLYFPSR